MTQNSNGNDKFKDWREVKIMENELISKNLLSHNWSAAFLTNFGHISHNVFLFLLLMFNRWMPIERSKYNGISVSFLYQFFWLVPLFSPLLFRLVFFSIFQFLGDTTLFRVTIWKQTYKRKKQFSRWQRL